MIPIGKIQFETRPGIGPDSGITVLIGRLELGQSIGFTKFERDSWPEGKKNFLIRKRNEIRRAMWERIARELRGQVWESKKMVRQAAYCTNPEDYRHIEKAFDLLYAQLEYNPALMDEKTMEEIAGSPATPPVSNKDDTQ